MSELTEMINQGGEAFVFLFLVIGALGIAVAMFIASPKKFIKSVLKDLWNSMIEKYGKKPEQEPYEPTAEELAKMDMTLEEWRAQNLDNIYTPEAPEIEKPKGK